MGGELTPDAIRMIVSKLIILILSICVHEFGHAYVADRLGDRLPRSEGRVSLNPFAHVDPIGTLMLPGVALLLSAGGTTGFGWGRPVMTQPASYTRRFSMRTGHMFVAFAGPFMNIVFGVFIAVLLMVLIKTGQVSMADSFNQDKPFYMLRYAVWMNFTLFFFNLIPSAPLDGGAVLRGLLPRRMLPAYDEYSRYGFFVLLAVMMSGRLAMIFVWPAQQMYEFVSKVLGI